MSTCFSRAIGLGAAALCLAATLAAGELRPVEAFPVRVHLGLDPVAVRLKAAENGTPPARLAARVDDADGGETARLAAERAPDGVWTFTFAPKDYGHYFLTVHDPADAATVWHATMLAVLRPLPERWNTLPAEDFRFGMNVHFEHRQGDPEVLPRLVRDAGFRWVRDTLYWGNVEKTAGVYAIAPERRAVMRTFKDDGVETLLCLCYGNKKLYPHDSSEAEAALYGKYAGFVAKELAGLVDHFEIWNEPNSFDSLSPKDYPRFLKAGYDAVKAANPKAVVIGIGGATPGGWSSHYMGEIEKAGGAGWMDAFSVHPYNSPYPAEIGYRAVGGPAPRSSLDYIRPITGDFAEKIRAAHGRDRRPGVWVTETGWPLPEAGTLARQAQQIARNQLYAASFPDDVARLFTYDFLCDGPDPENKEHNFGLVTRDYAPRPAYVAAAVAARAVDGLPFVRRVAHPDDSVRVYVYGRGDDAVVAAWATEIGPNELESGKLRDGRPVLDEVEGRKINRARVALAEPRPVVARLTGLPVRGVWQADWRDRRAPLVVAADGSATLTLTHWPRYLYGVGAAAEALAAERTPEELAAEQARHDSRTLTDFRRNSGAVTPDGTADGAPVGAIAYRFDDEQYAFREINLGRAKLPERPDRIVFAVFDDAPGLGFALRVRDVGGEIHQFSAPGRLTGEKVWKEFAFDLKPLKTEAWGGDKNKQLDLPAEVYALVVSKSAGVRADEGRLRLRDFVARTRKPAAE